MKMFSNPFKKKPKSPATPPAPESKSVSILDALGVSPYRTQPAKPVLVAKNKIRKPYRLPAIGYAVISFVSCIMSGVVSDVMHRYLPWTNAAQASCCLAFMCLAVFCGTQALPRWKH